MSSISTQNTRTFDLRRREDESTRELWLLGRVGMVSVPVGGTVAVHGGVGMSDGGRTHFGALVRVVSEQVQSDGVQQSGVLSGGAYISKASHT